jgi:hypothetical protein
MTNSFLFPYHFRFIGLLIFIPSLIIGSLDLYFENNLLSSFTTEFTDEISSIGIIVGLMLIAFSKFRNEDEMISYWRLQSLKFSFIVNYSILVIQIIVFYDFNFISVLIYNMFTPLLVYILSLQIILFLLKEDKL